MPRELVSAFMKETDQDTTLPSLNLADYNEISSTKTNTELEEKGKGARTRKEKRASREREGGVMRCSHISWVPVNDVAEPEVNEARETP
ncbi:hypothetical protein V6N11_059050 [Hibiscus sabdariffa]|uniref:Uncharacterized protein n=1 Tax=Hibiscus sabdariffa TaxID=183260 RepID=A0ABR2U608_9ROSI